MTTAAPAIPWLISGTDSDMPHDRYTQTQILRVFELLGVGQPLSEGQRCIVSLGGTMPILRRGTVTQVLEDGYAILLDGATTARAVLKHEAWGERSPIEFIQVAMLTGTQRPFVYSMACSKGIKPPSKAGKPRQGRPKGPGKKLGQRSPHRARAMELRATGMTYRDIAAKITEEVRAQAETPEGKAFKISFEAIRQLLTDDYSTKKKKS